MTCVLGLLLDQPDQPAHHRGVATQVNVAEAKAKLSDLVERAAAGEDIVIARNGRPRVRLVALAERDEPRRPGRWAGQDVFGPDWEADLTDDFEDLGDGPALLS